MSPISRWNRRISRCLILLAVVLGNRASGQAPGSEPIPEPPRQHEPWTPPASTIPKTLIDATALLFDQGLADPRGGEYRTVEVVTSNSWNHERIVSKRRGWVFPAKGDSPDRFAVSWNGLIYRLASVGEVADLDADIKRWVEQNRPKFSNDRELYVEFDTFGWSKYPDDMIPLNPVEVCLLLRLGRADLAETVWDGLKQQPNHDSRYYPYTYVTLATTLAASLWDRAASAQKRGDDAVVLHDARLLTRLQAAVDTTAPKLGFRRPISGIRRQPPLPYLGFLGQLPELLADAERRATEPPRPPIPPDGGADKAARIASLIRDLDQIRSNSTSGLQISATALKSAPPIQSLVAEGAEAVGPLIVALREDARLTRMVVLGDEHRGPTPYRHIYSTFDAAYEAVTAILKTREFTSKSSSGQWLTPNVQERADIADRVEVYWNRYKSVPLAERWYQILADDKASPASWLDAVARIVQPDNVNWDPPINYLRPKLVEPEPTTKPGPLRGELLRVGHSPSVTDLMIRRVQFLIPVSPPKQAEVMAKALLIWDREAALPMIQAISREIQGQYSWALKHQSFDRGPDLVTIGDYAIARHRLGDSWGLEEYAALIQTIEPDWVRSRALAALEPFWRLPDEPTLRETADWLLNDPKSPWAPILKIERESPQPFHGGSSMIASALIRSPGFRRAIASGLDDLGPFATAEVGPTGSIFIEHRSGRRSEHGRSRVDPLKPESGVRVPFRVADYVAWSLSSLEGAPDLEVYWPIANRDSAIVAVRAYLQRFGSRFVADNPSNIDLSGEFMKSAFLAFPALDHSATLAEEADGLAVFSLDRPDGPQAERRVVPLVARPLEASWTTLRDFPSQPGKTPSGEDRPLQYEQSGRVWQAEEIFEDGRWKRYFGFVGSHRVARVPAEEIAFGSQRFGSETGVGATWNVSYSFPKAARTNDQSQGQGYQLPLGEPVILSIGFQNRTGFDQTLPTELVRGRGESGVALANGATFALQSATFSPPGSSPSGGSQAAIAWRDIPLREKVGRFEPDAGRRTLRPAESSPRFEVDLLDLFAIDQPGRYQLMVDIGTDSDPKSKASQTLYFSMVPKK